MSSVLIAWCCDCASEQFFEPVPCADGHGADCPERCCTVCGAAVLVGDLPPVDVPVDAVA